MAVDQDNNEFRIKTAMVLFTLEQALGRLDLSDRPCDALPPKRGVLGVVDPRSPANVLAHAEPLAGAIGGGLSFWLVQGDETRKFNALKESAL